jgi:ABC-type multidrug transport system ATPase subunit
LLEAADLGFSYGRLRPNRVFENFNWQVTPGQTTLLLGPNGAGKSTLMRLLSGFDRPKLGEVRIGGVAERRELFRRVGWMPQEVQPGRGMTVAEQVEYVAWVAGHSRRQARESAREAISRVDLDDKRDARTDRLSGGQLRRVGLAQALVRQGEVLLLDEPTAGLDPAQALNFRSLLKDLDCPGGIVISTHQINDLVDDVDRVVILADAEIKFDGTATEFVQRHARTGDGVKSLTQAFSDLIGGGRH